MDNSEIKDNKEANKKFFNITADIYEEMDCRRNERTSRFIKKNIVELLKNHENHSLLDIGSGTGFVMRAIDGYFENLVGVDISYNVLKKIENGLCVCGDISNLAFKCEIFDVVTCFAVLHHCIDTASIFDEAYRVLKKGGVFYSDHDIDINFVRKFQPLLSLHRRVFDSAAKFIKANSEITKELYMKSEIRENGIYTLDLKEQLYKAGFSKVEIRSHWYGQGGLYDFIMKLLGNPVSVPLGYAPSVAFRAIK